MPSLPESLLADRPATARAAAVLMLVSGFAGLAYQIVWTQQLGTWLGHEIAAVLAVVSAFFGGLALGAWAGGRRIARSARPALWYAVLEALIAAWALLLVAVLPLAGAALTQAIGDAPGALRHWAIAFGGPFLLLLPATAAMGATLPAMERVLGRLRDQGYAVGGLYACNTLGAVGGTLAAAFWLAPTLGLNATATLAAALNLVCAALAWRWLGRPQRPAPPPQPAPGTRAAAPLWRLGVGGLLGIGVEVLVVRVLSQLATNTVYTYALMLAVYLLGTAAGAAAYQRWVAPRGATHRWRARLVAATVFGGLLTIAALGGAPALKAALAARLGADFGAVLAVESLLALAAFALPAAAMGALFSQLAVEARDAGWGFGHALAANTLGASAAAPLFGVLLLPLVGAGPLLGAVALGYCALLPAAAWRGAWGWVPVASAAAVLATGPALRMVELPPGSRLLSHAEGVLAAVSVIEGADGVRRLHINNREQEGSSATRVADARQAWIPLLLHPAPQRALFLGLGTGVTASAAVEPGLRVEVIELVPEVVDAARLFVPALAQPGLPPAPQVHVADARRHVRASGARHDVIVADLFHPARSGSAALYTVEHFEAVRARLAAGGLFCQWLPLHQLDLASLRSIVAAFVAVYPEAIALLASHSLDTPVIGLVGRADALPWRPGPLQARLAAAQDRPALAGLQLDDRWAVPGSVLADATSLRSFAGTTPPNRDDRPQVAYLAPRLRDAADGSRERLRTLLEAWQAETAAVFGLPRDADESAWQQRVAAYWRARDHYLLAGMAVRPSPQLERMLAQVRGPLLATLQMSPDFRPAYDPLLRMAVALGRSDPAGARALLGELQAAQPARAEADEALRRLAGPS